MSVLVRIYICFLAFCIGIPGLQAQEEEFFDDTTQEEEVYNTQTTLFITPADLKYNQAGFRPIVISINQIDRFTHRQRAAYKLQDLGNDGTAAQSIFYALPGQIGAHTGFEAYNIYFQDPYAIQYYDTKSPYTTGTIVLANLGTYTFDVCHSRSLNKNWHLGASLATMLIDKEYIPQEIPGDRHVITYPFTLFVHYHADDKKYQLLGSFYRKNHRVRETGGIFGNKNLPLASWLQAKSKISNNLRPQDHIESHELRQQYHLYHQLHFIDQLQAYHDILLRNTFNLFKATKLSDSSKQYLGDPLINIQDSIQDSYISQTVNQEWGLKGDINKVFYCCYYLHKSISFQQPYQKGMDQLQEHYIGLQTRIKLNNQQDLLQVKTAYLLGGLYQLHASYQGAIGELAYDQVQYKPSFLSQHCQGTFRNWNNNFTASTTRQLHGTFFMTLPMVVMRPYCTVTQAKRPIYFKQLNQQYTPSKQSKSIHTRNKPKQAKQHANIINLGTAMNFNLLTHFHADNAITFTKVQGPAAKVFRIPQWWFNTRLYYAKTLYEGRLDLETGLDLHWNSPYQGDGYDPVTQQFYLQDQFLLYDYPIADLFFNFRIQTFRGFIKITHINQGLPAEGYFTTPFYPGQLRSIDVGVSWSFFD